MKIFKSKKYSILSKILKYSFVIVVFVCLISPFYFAKAEKCLDGTIQTTCTPGNTTGGPGNTTGGVGITNKIVNPLNSDIDTIPKFINELIKIVLYVGIPIVALAIIYTGFLFVEAQGSPEKITKAKKALLYTLIGAVLLLGAFVIANAIGKTVDEIKSST